MKNPLRIGRPPDRMKKIELPRKVIVGENAIYEIKNIIKELNLTKPLIICGENTKKFAEIIYKEIDGNIKVINKDAAINDDILIKNFDNYNNKSDNKTNFVCGVGGGMNIDIAKIFAYKNKIPFISIPTVASHDGIASPQVASKVFSTDTKFYTSFTKSPIAIIVDTNIIKNAPRRLTSAGFGDVISNLTAVLDWKLASKEINEYYGDYAAALASMSAEICINNGKKIFEDISILVEALISSGVAIAIAGSSRPCSGSDHLFSHAIDKLSYDYKFEKALHGEQCGMGTIISAYLYELASERNMIKDELKLELKLKYDWRKIRETLKAVNAPVDAKGLNIKAEYLIEALKLAPKIRDRYTILNKFDIEKEAEEILKGCLII